MKEKLKPNGELLVFHQHRIHLYRTGKRGAVKLVFLSGSGTVAPGYDFKALYEKLEEDFRIIVIEKPGYGYSDLFEIPCDIDSLVSMQREILKEAGENSPYVLIPHSMSGLEAIRWKQMYPDEIAALIGIDMATPLTYANWTEKEVSGRIRMMQIFRTLKLHHFLNIPPISTESLSAHEIRQLKLLRKRNAFNICFQNEAKAVLQNAETVKQAEMIICPILLFCSDGKQNSIHWVESQREFASMTNAELIQYDCGHYIHHYRSEEMSGQIREFINDKTIDFMNKENGK